MNERRINFERTLSETIKLLCRGEFQKEERFTINGTIGVSLPNDRIFLVGIHEEIINKNGRIHEESPTNLNDEAITKAADEGPDVNNFDILPMLVDEENQQKKQEDSSSSINWDDDSDSLSLNSSNALNRRDSETDTDSKRSVINCSNEETSPNPVQLLTIKKEANTEDYQCTDCGKCFDKSSLLKRHKVVHNSSKPFLCSFCDSAFKWRNNALRHERIVHGEKKKTRFQAISESSNFAQSSNTNKSRGSAVRTSLERNRVGLKLSEAALNKRKRICNPERPFMCNICKASFTWKSNLYRHKRFQHHTDSSTALSCSACNVHFDLKANYDKHMESCRGGNTPDGSNEIISVQVKNGEKPEKRDRNDVSARKRTFSCKICELKFDYKDGLVSHIIRDHKALKKFS
ncbi:DgyrCDS12903 [Dimorphilus gyrociliatus]|uniref:DgyrCDS12903 n=1 Tax=Dimorphilus gyrociliatus TaxID=2664684 RepID=A0A7I8W935_9ANNE|nr:DgyrCDS12903 [Dimorphilus gyrociliatus]